MARMTYTQQFEPEVNGKLAGNASPRAPHARTEGRTGRKHNVSEAHRLHGGRITTAGARAVRYTRSSSLVDALRQLSGTHPPQTVLSSDSVAVFFKLRLKTFLFSRAFSSFSAH